MTRFGQPPFDDGGEDPEDPEPSVRLARPAPIELAAAILITGAVFGLIGTFAAVPGLPAGTEPLVAVTAALDLGALLVGLLIRFGRAWIVAVNYVAVLGFLDLMAGGGSGLSLTLGIADIIVVVILVVHKPWFDARRLAPRPPRPGPPVGGG